MIMSFNNLATQNTVQLNEVNSFPEWYKNERYYLCDNFQSLLGHKPSRRMKKKN